MSAEPRYYYVDAQNQASGPIAMAGLLALKAAGTITDATLVVLEGGAERIAFSTLKAEGASQGGAAALRSSAPEGAAPSGAGALHSSAPEGVRSEGGPASVGTAEALHSSAPEGVRSEGGSSSSAPTAEPLWSFQLSQKIDQLTSAMQRLTMALEKALPAAPVSPVMAPATAALHAEKINLNPTPKPGIATLNPATALPGATLRPGFSITLSPLAIPANAQKSALPLPALGKIPGAAPAGTPTSTPAPGTAPAKGNIFSKFLKK